MILTKKLPLFSTLVALASGASAAALEKREGECSFSLRFARGQVHHPLSHPQMRSTNHGISIEPYFGWRQLPRLRWGGHLRGRDDRDSGGPVQHHQP